jgi:hypothetical protein
MGSALLLYIYVYNLIRGELGKTCFLATCLFFQTILVSTSAWQTKADVHRIVFDCYYLLGNFCVLLECLLLECSLSMYRHFLGIQKFCLWRVLVQC